MTRAQQLKQAQAVLDGRRQWAVLEGDCLKWLAELPDFSVDHIITDPPYSAHVHAKNRRMLRGAGRQKVQRAVGGLRLVEREAKRSRKYRQVGLVPLDFEALSHELRQSVAQQLGRLCRRWCLVFTNAEGQHLWEAALGEAGLNHVRVGAWVKLCAQPQLTGDRPGTGFEAIEITHAKGEKLRWNGGGHPALWTHRIATSNNDPTGRLHTTQKPLPLMLELVAQFTQAAGFAIDGGDTPADLVLDPFCGSASTGVACLRLGTRFLGVEKKPEYARIARARLAAEERGLSLADARRGQSSWLDAQARPLT